MSKKSELKKYRKNTLPEIQYKNIYIDGVIETKEGFFTKTYVFKTDANLEESEPKQDLSLVLSVINSDIVNSFIPEITYFGGHFYLTLGIEAPSYESSLNMFNNVQITSIEQLGLLDRMNLLHKMYQNDDSFEERFKAFSDEKKMSKKKKEALGSKLKVQDIYSPNYPLEERMKLFKKNGKISKDLILPAEFVTSPTEMEFEGNYVRFFYFKNMPRYISEEFIEDVLSIENVIFSLHFKRLSQDEIIEYTSIKFKDVKDLKTSQMKQKEFFDNVTPGLKRSAKMGETMLLTSFIIGVPNDSIDAMEKMAKKLTRHFEENYVLKVLKYQQKTAFNAVLPFCNDKLNIKNTMFYKNEDKEVDE